MPTSNYSIVWNTLFYACQKWKDVNVGLWAFECAVKLDKSDGPAYVLMAKIYATTGMGEKEKNIKTLFGTCQKWADISVGRWVLNGR